METRRVGMWVGLYVAAFVALTGADIASTHWAIGGGGGQEFNAVVATDTGSLHTERLLLVNAAFLAFSTAMLAWALRVRDRIDPRYLAQPARALFNYWYINPFSNKIVPKSAFHYIALAPTVLLMKAFAAFNNSLIGAQAPDIVTPLAKAVASLGTGAWTYWVVIFIIFHPLWFAALALTARALRSAPVPRLAVAAAE